MHGFDKILIYFKSCKRHVICTLFTSNDCMYTTGVHVNCKYCLHVHNRCTCEYPSWTNLCGPSLDCTANLQTLNAPNLQFRCLKLCGLTLTQRKPSFQATLGFQATKLQNKYLHKTTYWQNWANYTFYLF